LVPEQLPELGQLHRPEARDPASAGHETLAVVEPVADASPKAVAVKEAPAVVGRSLADADLSPMTSARDALLADENATRTLLAMVASADAVLVSAPSSARIQVKPAKRKLRAIDIAHVPSGLDGPELVAPSERNKRNALVKTPRKLAQNGEFYPPMAWE
jgi:hypothetical protein